MRIGIDLMGGDYAPKEAVLGVKAFLDEHKDDSLLDDVTLCLLGEESLAMPIIEQANLQFSDSLQFISCDVSVNFKDSASRVFKEKPNASLCKGFMLLQQNEIDSFFSAGHTGSMLVGAHTIIKPFPNVARPSIGTSLVPYPSEVAPSFLLDVGSNVECKPEQLNQFAILGSIYMKAMYKMDKVTVGLLNVGEEPNKGSSVYIEAYKLLEANQHIDFIGNIEGRDILNKKTANVIVCDGFIGNVVLKLLESIYDVLELKKSESATNYYKYFNFEQHGGVPILGIHKPVIVGHGISSSKAFSQMINLSINLIQKDFCNHLQMELQKCY